MSVANSGLAGMIASLQAQLAQAPAQAQSKQVVNIEGEYPFTYFTQGSIPSEEQYGWLSPFPFRITSIHYYTLGVDNELSIEFSLNGNVVEMAKNSKKSVSFEYPADTNLIAKIESINGNIEEFSRHRISLGIEYII